MNATTLAAIADLKQAAAALNQNATFPADVALARAAIARAIGLIRAAELNSDNE